MKVFTSSMHSFHCNNWNPSNVLSISLLSPASFPQGLWLFASSPFSWHWSHSRSRSVEGPFYLAILFSSLHLHPKSPRMHIHVYLALHFFSTLQASFDLLWLLVECPLSISISISIFLMSPFLLYLAGVLRSALPIGKNLQRQVHGERLLGSGSQRWIHKMVRARKASYVCQSHLISYYPTIPSPTPPPPLPLSLSLSHSPLSGTIADSSSCQYPLFSCSLL